MDVSDFHQSVDFELIIKEFIQVDLIESYELFKSIEFSLAGCSKGDGGQRDLKQEDPTDFLAGVKDRKGSVQGHESLF